MKKSTRKRTSQALRDALFEELEELREGDGDPTRAMAVANLAKQIISVTKIELEFHRLVLAHNEAGNSLTMGSLALGSDAQSAEPSVKAPTN